MLAKYMLKTAIILSLFALIGTGLVAFIQEQTRGRILASERASLLRNLHAVLDPASYNNNLFDDLTLVTSENLGTNKPVAVFRARKDNVPVAVILNPVAPDGYNGDINLLVSVKLDGSIAGVRVISHRETPGLGDFIETRRSDWVLGFNQKSLTNPDPKKWRVKRDGGEFDQYTGATITPRAIVKAVHKTLQYVEQNKATLFAPVETPKPTTEIQQQPVKDHDG